MDHCKEKQLVELDITGYTEDDMEFVYCTQCTQAFSPPTTTSSSQQWLQEAELPCIPAPVSHREKGK